MKNTNFRKNLSESSVICS